MSSSLKFHDSTVQILGPSWKAPYPIAHAKFLDGRILLIYDYRLGPQDAPFYNLEAFDVTGRKLWAAEHSGSGSTNAYVEFISDDPLTVWSFAGLLCVIDPQNGHLISAVFTK